MTSNHTYNNWHLTTDNNDIAYLSIDKKDSATNVLNGETLDELNHILDGLALTLPTGVIIYSAKSSGFIAGADINEFLEIKNISEATRFIQRGQNVFNKLEQLHCPTVCLIDGFCMGGGLELALACDYRVAISDSKTRLALPEVKLGIHPAYGGVARATAKLKPIQAMLWMLKGKAVDPKKAKKMGLVDYIVPSRQGISTCSMLVLKKPTVRSQSLIDKACNAPLIRQLIAFIIKQKMAKKVSKTHYPAPFALLDLWSKHNNTSSLMSHEVSSVAKLMQHQSVKNLIRVFFLQSALKNQTKTQLEPCLHVHVIGGGIMGGDIAAWCALKGMKVTLQDRAPEYLENAMARAHQLFKKRTASKAEYNTKKDSLIADINGLGVAKADVVIEAIFENIEAKQALYKTIEPQLKPSALLATNTSSIPLETLASGLDKPNRLFGLHFFNPVAQMPLVEIVKTEHTDRNTIDKSLAFAKQIGKLPLVVKSAPGFLVNRILVPYLLEAVILFNEGHSPEKIDQAALNFGMPLGPIELADTIGLDICLSVANNLSQHYSFEVPSQLQSLVDSKKLGKKSGVGFYSYKDNKAVKNKYSDYEGLTTIQNRLMMRLINESYKCLREGIVTEADHLDAGVIFGTGFAPFTGGPLHYVEQKGESVIHQIMLQLSSSVGERFEPDSSILS